MRIWVCLFPIAFICQAEAGIQRASHSEDDGLKSAVHRSDPIDEIRSPTRGQEDIEDAPRILINANEFGAPPGGGLPRLDPSLLKPVTPTPSWMESFWNWMKAVFR